MARAGPRRLLLRPGAFASRIGYNGLAQVAPMVVTLALTPVLISRLGIDRFGIWSLAVIAMSTITSLDGGISASLARFFAIHAAHDDRKETRRLLAGSLVFFTLFGLALTAVAFVVAPPLVGLLHVPTSLENEAVWIFRWLPLLATLALAADGAAALLQGHGDFREFAVASSVSAGVFAVSVLVLVQSGAHLRELFAAAALRYVAMGAVGLILARRHLELGRPLLPSRSTVREVGRYSSRMQVAAMTGFVNAELDAFVIAAFAEVRYVGLYSIGLQAASAARSIPLYAFSPLLTRLTTTFRREGRASARRDFELLEERWLPSVLGYGVLALSAIGFSVTVWLGEDYVLSGVTAVVLLSGYIVHVAFTGIRTCYVRAVGRPGLEARYSAVWTICNAALTVPLALLAGMVGVVSATAATGMLASLYFVFLSRREERLPLVLPSKRWWILAATAATLTVAGEIAVLRTDVHGFVGLAMTGVPPLVALAIVAPLARQRLPVLGRTPTTDAVDVGIARRDGG
jgi:O-antigen/teichoic acid export membrane protein